MVRLIELDARYADVLRQKLQIDGDALEGYLAEEVLGWSISRLVCLGEAIVGLIQVRKLDLEQGWGVLGTWLLPSVWGTGVNQDAKRLMLQLLFTEYPEIDRVYLCIEEANFRSIRAARKLPYAVEIGPDEVPVRLLQDIPPASGRWRWFVIGKRQFYKSRDLTQDCD